MEYSENLVVDKTGYGVTEQPLIVVVAQDRVVDMKKQWVYVQMGEGSQEWQWAGKVDILTSLRS